MKEVIEMFTKPPSNDFEGWLVLSLVWLCFVLVIGLIVAGLLAAINSWFRPKIEGYGEV